MTGSGSSSRGGDPIASSARPAAGPVTAGRSPATPCPAARSSRAGVRAATTTTIPRGTNWYHSPFYYSRYSPYYYSGFGASVWGLGYIWDPFWWGPGYYDPWGGGYGPGYGGYGFGGGGGYSAGDDDDDIEGEGGLRIKVKPREARVLVDGTLAGTVDDFDGNFQRLRLEAGAHKIELQADGFEPLRFDVMIVEGQTVTYKGTLRDR